MNEFNLNLLTHCLACKTILDTLVNHKIMNPIFFDYVKTIVNNTQSLIHSGVHINEEILTVVDQISPVLNTIGDLMNKTT